MINNVSIPVVKSAKYLGIHIDNKLNFEDHINYIGTKVSRSIGIMSKLKPYVPMNVLKCVYFAFVHSHLQYGQLIWSATYKTHLSKLQRMQNKAVKIASGSGWSEKAEPYYLNLNVLKLHELKQFQICKFMFQFTHKQLPTKFNDYFQEISLVSVRETGNSNKFKQYYMPRYKTSRLQNSIKFSGVKAWNKLTNELKQASFYHFQKELKKLLLNTTNTD